MLSKEEREDIISMVSSMCIRSEDFRPHGPYRHLQDDDIQWWCLDYLTVEYGHVCYNIYLSESRMAKMSPVELIDYVKGEFRIAEEKLEIEATNLIMESERKHETT